MDYLSLLKAYPNFSHTAQIVPPSFQYFRTNYFIYENCNEIKKINEVFNINIDATIDIDNEIERICYLKRAVINALDWTGINILDRKYDGMTYLDIIANAKKNGEVLNCRYKSFVFYQLLIFLGFKARWVGCMPMDENDKECHCITEVYSMELNKWVAIDVSFDYLYFDPSGMLLNLIEIRNNLIQNKKVRFISKDKRATYDTKHYLEKNLFKFRFIESIKYNSTIKSAKTVLLYPTGYSLSKSERKQYSYVTNNILPFWNEGEKNNV